MSAKADKNAATEKLFENKIWLNIDEAAAYSGMKKSMLYKHSIYGIPCHSTTGKKNGALRFHKDELDQWWDERKIS